MTSGHHRALEVAERAALQAGELLRQEFHRSGGPRGSDGHAEVDKESEWIIRRQLTEAFPDWGYRGEETSPDKEAADRKRVWLVDPNDGTNAYLEGYRGSAISIGLISEGLPVLGVVYAFVAPDDKGDLFTWAEGCGPLRRNGKPIAHETWPPAINRYSIVLLSQVADQKPEANARLVASGRFRSLPSIAYRLALVAAGEATVGVSLNAPGDWDYAGGHALIRAAGGTLLNESAQPVTYSVAGHSSTRLCFGGSPQVARELASRDWSAVWRADSQEQEPYTLVHPVPGQSLADSGVLSRAQGCLLGQLAGDALGSLVEFQSAAEIRRKYPAGIRKMIDGGAWNTIAGQPTDDSELALMLARSIVQTGGYDPESAARAYRYWYRSHPFDIGATTSAPLGAISEEDVRKGTAAFAARHAANPRSQANGSLMRVSPLAIWGHTLATDQLANHARADAALTHPHPVCQDAAAVYCVAISHAISTGESPQGVYERAMEWATTGIREQVVLEALRKAETGPPEDFSSHEGWVLIALQNAFYRLLHSSTLEGVVDTIMAGGDTDTNAAIAGALLGAVHGRDAVASDWVQMVLTCRPIQGLAGVRHPRPRGFWPVDAPALAERLATLGEKPGALTVEGS